MNDARATMALDKQVIDMFNTATQILFGLAIAVFAVYFLEKVFETDPSVFLGSDESAPRPNSYGFPSSLDIDAGITGEQLYEMCSPAPWGLGMAEVQSRSSECQNFIRAKALELLESPTEPLFEIVPPPQLMVCMPSSYSRQIYFHAVMLYLELNRDKWHLPANVLISNAMVQTFSCEG